MFDNMIEGEFKSEYAGKEYPSGVFVGKAARWNNLDSGGLDASGIPYADIMLPGLFNGKELSRFEREGNSMRGHGKPGARASEGYARAIGYPLAAKDTGKGLEVAFAFHSTEDAQNERTKIQERLAAGKSADLSIWYRVNKGGYERFAGKSAIEGAIKKYVSPELQADALARAGDYSYVRVLKSARLSGVDTVPEGMDQYAEVIDAKGAEENMEQGKASEIAPEGTAWDAAAAEKRIRKATGAEDEPNAAYAKNFLWHDKDNADKFTSYKLLIADVVGGKIKIVAKAVYAVAAVLNGARGGLKIPDADKAAIKTKVAALYKKIASAFDNKAIIAPWEKKSLDAPMFSARASFDRYEAKGLYEDELTERTDNCYFLWDVLQGVRYDISCMAAAADDLGVAFDPESAIDEVLTEFTARYKAAWMKEFEDEEDEAAEMQEDAEPKSSDVSGYVGKQRTAHPLQLRGQAEGLGILTRSLIARTEKVIAQRIAEQSGKEARTLSDATMQPMEDAANAMMAHGKKLLDMVNGEKERRKNKTAATTTDTTEQQKSATETSHDSPVETTKAERLAQLKEIARMNPHLQISI